jgi:regulatory protein
MSFKKTSPSNPPAAPPSPARLRSLAFALLARREWSRQALTDKLLETGAPAEQVATLVDELVDRQYQSDERMAHMLVRANIRKGRGPARLKQDLKQHAVDHQLAEPDIQQTDWLALASALRQKKFGATLPTDPKEQARQVRFLQYRGFDINTCQRAIRWNEDNHDEEEC